MHQSQPPRLLLIELNEFSTVLFRRGVEELSLPNVSRLLNMKHSSTVTDDLIEHRGLDPWVQWVSVHTGSPSSVHEVIHLGDAPSALGVKQLWEVLSQRGVSSGIWGAMNATRSKARSCLFFLPDPWTFEERAFPSKLNDLLALPRYYSKNYLDFSVLQFSARTLQLLRYIVRSGAMRSMAGLAPFILKGLARNGLNNAVLFSLFDLLSACFFLAQRRRFRPQLSLIFLNSIAHLQHHKWEVGDQLSDSLRFGLETIDKVLGMLFASQEKGEALVIMNALTQRNISCEKPRICYRQINPSSFLRVAGISFQAVEQLMTNDAHVFFADVVARDAAAAALEAVYIDGKKLFQVERSARDERKLFYQVDFWDELEGPAEILINGRTVRFQDHFEAIVARTGAHVPQGDIFAEGIDFPRHLYNHEVCRYLLEYWDAPQHDVSENHASLAVAGA